MLLVGGQRSTALNLNPRLREQQLSDEWRRTVATLQIGNRSGFAARGSQATKLADITAEGANTFTVAAADLRKFYAGQVIDVATKATGAVTASARIITNITSAGVITYNGADAVTTVAEGVYPTGQVAASGRSNINGGIAPMEGLDFRNDTANLANKRARLAVINATYYTSARLNQITENDMDYAIRLSDAPGSI